MCVLQWIRQSCPVLTRYWSWELRRRHLLPWSGSLRNTRPCSTTSSASTPTWPPRLMWPSSPRTAPPLTPPPPQVIVIPLMILRGAVGEVFNFYSIPPRILIFGTHMPPAVTMHVSLILCEVWLLFLEIRTYIQNLSPRTNFKYMINNFFHSILNTSGKRLIIHISEI